jgi:hypothetical protein
VSTSPGGTPILISQRNDQDRKSDTPDALWDARFASVLVPGPATPPGRLNLMLPAHDGEALIDGCLPVAVMVGEDAR